MAYYCDLHCHTTLSDGNDTPFELIEHAAQRGVHIIGITDHDILPRILYSDVQEKETLADFAFRLGVRVFHGVEFSCETNIEDVHIIGFGCDWESEEVKKIVDLIELNKGEAYLETIKRLGERGIDLSIDELVGSGDMLRFLPKKRIFDLMAKKGYANGWSEAKKMVRNDPYLSVKRVKPTAKEAIESIHKAGGVCILAHPYLIDEHVEFGRNKIHRDELIAHFIALGLDGIEVRYTYNKSTCKDRRAQETIWQEIDNQYRGKLFISGGSDYHNDRTKNILVSREIGECGLTVEEFNKTPISRMMC